MRIFDKGRGVGGRMATRRIGDCTFDHGAQFIAARSARFSAAVRAWETAGVAESWCRGFSAQADGHTRWRGKPSMNAIPKHLARGLSIQLDTKVVSLAHDGNDWLVAIEGGGHVSAQSLILASPVPQSLALINSGNLRLDPGLRQQLAGIEYELCFAVMAILKAPSLVPGPGGFAPPAGDVAGSRIIRKKEFPRSQKRGGFEPMIPW